MHPNEQLIERFYACFQARDAAGMSACYDPEVVFSDPVFGPLRGAVAASMWHMLCSRATDLKITFSNVRADESSGSAHWEARYTFTKTGRPVHNIIDAVFVFKDGRIIRHDDFFSLRKWAGMALGPVGTFFGWTPIVKGEIRKEAQRSLDIFRQRQK